MTIRPSAPPHAGSRRALAVLLAAAIVGAPMLAAAQSSPRGAAPPVARARLVGLAPPFLLPLGRSARLSVEAWDARDARIPTAPRWRVQDPAVLELDAATGTIRARRAGFSRVGATLGDTTAWWSVAVAPPADSVELAISRRTGGTKAVLVSSGVPLVPGALRPGEESRVRLRVGRDEPPVRVVALSSRHPDGSVRAVLVQFRLPAGDTATGATLLIGAPRRAPAFAGVTPPALPDAALLPTEPDYLIATDLVGPTRSVRETQWMGGAFRRYDADFATFAEQRWQAEGARWEGNYYDRALVFYAAWVRSANPKLWWRATEIATRYRKDYLEPNDYGASPHWAQMEGVEKHYLLTGDEASRLAVVRVAEKFTQFLPEFYHPGGGDVRIMARFVHGALLAWRLTPGGAPPAGAPRRDWGERVDFLLQKVAAWERPEGVYTAAVACGTQMNYQVGLLNDALIKVHDYYRADPALVARVQRAVDNLWRTQWVPRAAAFQYLAKSCPNVGGLDPTGDLTGLMVSAFGWVWRETGDPTYRFAGDQVFAGMVAQAYLAGDKQFNQAYTSSFLYLGWR